VSRILWLALGFLLLAPGSETGWSAAEGTKVQQLAQTRKASKAKAKKATKKTKKGRKSKQAAEKGGMGDLFADNNEPIVITSDRMELDRKNSTIIYRGNVLTVRGELRLKSDTLSGVIDFAGAGLKTIVAAGNVRVIQEGRTATGDKAIFDSEKETITLVGNPVIQQGNSKISGDRVIVYLKEDRGVVEGGNQRVKAVIFPGELNK